VNPPLKFSNDTKPKPSYDSKDREHKPSYDFKDKEHKPSYDFKDKDVKNSDFAYKKPQSSRNDWDNKDKPQGEKSNVRQLNPGLLSRPSKPFSNEGGYGKPQGRGYNEGKPRQRKYD